MQSPQTKECWAPLPKVQLNSLGSLVSATRSDSHPALLAGLQLGHLHSATRSKGLDAAICISAQSQIPTMGAGREELELHCASHLSPLDLSYLICKKEITPQVLPAVTSESLHTINTSLRFYWGCYILSWQLVPISDPLPNPLRSHHHKLGLIMYSSSVWFFSQKVIRLQCLKIHL